jgi:hypothetical protein
LIDSNTAQRFCRWRRWSQSIDNPQPFAMSLRARSVAAPAVEPAIPSLEWFQKLWNSDLSNGFPSAQETRVQMWKPNIRLTAELRNIRIADRIHHKWVPFSSREKLLPMNKFVFDRFLFVRIFRRFHKWWSTKIQKSEFEWITIIFQRDR